MVFGRKSVLLVEASLSLKIARQVVIVGEVEAFSQVFCNFLDDLRYLSPVKFVGLEKLALLFVRRWEKWHQQDRFESVDARRGGVCPWLLVGGQLAHFLALCCNYKVVQTVYLEDAKESADFVADSVSVVACFQIVLLRFQAQLVDRERPVEGRPRQRKRVGCRLEHLQVLIVSFVILKALKKLMTFGFLLKHSRLNRFIFFIFSIN